MLVSIAVYNVLPMGSLCIVALLGQGCGEEPCNGDERLCSRTLPEVAFATTHNAMSSAEARWLAPNQRFGPARQLEDGVRAMMLDLHYWNKEVALCHSQCEFGNTPLRELLNQLRVFLEANPREVVTLILESYVDRVDVARALAAARLDLSVRDQPVGAPWPTLGQLLERDERLVIITDRGGGVYPWLLAVWDHAWETDWNNKTAADLTCKRNRGAAGNPLFILNHFIGNPLPSPGLALSINRREVLLERARRCKQESGRQPNFVTVDFHDQGDLISVVRELNGL